MRVDPFYVTNLSSALDQTQVSEQQLTSELSSGVRISQVSQDPVAAGENVVLLNQIQADDSFTQSSSLVTGQLQVADSALSSVVTQLTSAISLATAANNGTNNSNDTHAISSQLTGILDEVQTLANSSYQGQYIFAGAQTSTIPFATNTGTTPSTTTYAGDQDVNYLVTPTGQKIQLNVPGSQIFQGSGSNNVFTALNSLIADYSGATVDTNQAVKDTSALNTALNYVSEQRVTIDNSINQVTAASDAITGVSTQLESAQNNLMQADVASVSTQLSLSETQQTALEDVISQLNSTSNTLFSKIQA
jgi:flagellar hook-associated protein 3 FlgL